MKVLTSDNKTIDDFDKLLGVVEVLREAIMPKNNAKSISACFSKLAIGSEYSPISSSSSSSSNRPTKSLAEYNVQSQSKEEFGENMKSVLDKMGEYHWTGKVYSPKTGEVFTDDFSKELNKLLGLLQSLQTPN
ncbi:MAG: hypothetical protein LBI81_00010 [Puniceicoccales bacterium]|jgi:hypothetical protein|nr:hypothetical protein [Puniceicoccales bacterium]